MKSEENNTPTLGENTQIDYVGYCTGIFNEKEYMFFDVELQFNGILHCIIIEEKDVDEPNSEPRMRVECEDKDSMPCRTHLETNWKRLLAICKHERRRVQQEEHEFFNSPDLQ